MISVRTLVLGLITAASAWPLAAAAQEPQPEARPRVRPEAGPQIVRDRMRWITQRRARLGVTVDLQPSANDSIGATIESVTPGGPAAKAGIKSGDIITKLNGKLLAAEGKKERDDESLPALRLVEIASQLKANETVSVEYLRDGTRHTTSLITGDEPFTVFETPEGQLGFAFPRMTIERWPQGYAFGTGPGAFTFELGGPLMNLQLAPLNPDLGQYFGTTEGVLVIDVPKESSLGVKGGDVILTVDGRKATGPASLLRILRSYDPGDSFKLEIMRNKSRMTVTGKIEKRRDD